MEQEDFTRFVKQLPVSEIEQKLAVPNEFVNRNGLVTAQHLELIDFGPVNSGNRSVRWARVSGQGMASVREAKPTSTWRHQPFLDAGWSSKLWDPGWEKLHWPLWSTNFLHFDWRKKNVVFVYKLWFQAPPRSDILMMFTFRTAIFYYKNVCPQFFFFWWILPSIAYFFFCWIPQLYTCNSHSPHKFI